MASDVQDIVSWLWSLLTLPIGWIWHMVNKNRDDLARHRQHVAESYARRDDLKDGFEAIQIALRRIEDKLDQKADKPR